MPQPHTRKHPEADNQPPYRTVRRCHPDHPGQVETLRLRWLCPEPTCRRPRGTPTRHHVKYHDAAKVIATAHIDLWQNSCGHHELTQRLFAEAEALATTKDAR